jgi:hypothetical protein
MARPRDPRRPAIWRDRISRQQASGLTIEQFCAQEGVARSKFQAWKRRFHLEDFPPDQCPTSPAPSAFLPVTVRLLQPVSHSSAPGLPIEADLPNGIHLRIPTGDPHLACRLIRAVAKAKTSSGGAR